MAWTTSREDPLYLSDVHVSREMLPFETRYLSRFFFKYPSEPNNSYNQKEFILTQEAKGIAIKDEEGDFDLDPRVSHSTSFADGNTSLEGYPRGDGEGFSSQEVITLEHMMQTNLQDVGYQVWPGAFLLCDYLLHYHDSFREKVVLDLGAGTGLTSIVAALCSKKIICTDYCSEIIDLAKRNWLRNEALLPKPVEPVDMEFLVLDWTENTLKSSKDFETSWSTNQDKSPFFSATVILAAEAIYDDDLTDAFFRTIYHLLIESPEKFVLMAVEKRIIFSSISHDVCSPAYEHFMENLKDLSSVDEGDIRFTYLQIPTHNLPQYFMYTRSKELELWKISSKSMSRSPDVSAVT